MADYPRISKGLGKFTADVFNRLMDMLQWHERNYRLIELKGPKRREAPQEGGRSFFMIQITASHPIPGLDNRWTYEWIEADLNPFNFWGQKEDGRSSDPGDETTRARNIVEADNSGDGLESYGINVDPFTTAQATIRIGVRPIPVDSFVFAWVDTIADVFGDENPSPVWFHAQNGSGATVQCLEGDPRGFGTTA